MAVQNGKRIMLSPSHVVGRHTFTPHDPSTCADCSKSRDKCLSCKQNVCKQHSRDLSTARSYLGHPPKALGAMAKYPPKDGRLCATCLREYDGLTI